MKYRKEIDGLRAVALLPVILFHAGFDLFSGGFIGVDVFFVISGYLITRIILSEQAAGKFTILGFYERRARRILPALFCVIIATLPFAWKWMLPDQLNYFSQNLVAVSLFFSNVFFWLQSGYFEAAAELKPFLHTWSLAVEEQYYILFPLFVILTWRFGKRQMFIALLLLGLSSFLLAQWGTKHFPSANFFLLPTRLWELLIGSLTAFYSISHIPENAKTHGYRSEILSSLGFLLIVYSIFGLNDQIPFPGVYTLMPTVGTSLIILYGTDKTLTGRFLSNGLFVGIGLVSYSAYLWHQPLFAFARLRSVNEPSQQLMLSLGLLTLLLAFITWKYVEQPFRDKARFSRKAILQGAAFFSFLTISIGTVGQLNNGFDTRAPENAAPLVQEKLNRRMRINFGLNEACTGFNLSEKCRTDDKPEILLWGDSHAMHLAQGIVSSNPDAKLIQFTKSVCGPILGIAPTNKKYPLSWAEKCIEFNSQVKKWLEKNSSVRYAILASTFTKYVMKGSNVVTPDGIVSADPQLAFSYFASTLKFLQEQGIQPVIITSPPSNGIDIGNCLSRSALLGTDKADCNIDVAVYRHKNREVKQFLKRLDETYRVVWLEDFLCDDVTCKAELDGQFIYRDKWHLSHEGSAYIGKQMDFYGLATSGM